MINTRIGILNFQHSNHNYGAVIQACALEYVLKDHGFYVEHINYLPQKDYVGRLKDLLRPYLRFTGLIKESSQVKQMKGDEVFENFRIKWLNRTSETYRNKNSLSGVGTKFDTVIVGSDQVWRTAMTEESGLIYFLDFLPYNVKRVSYAASFGVDSWEVNDELFNKQVRDELLKFDAISVREKSGLDICNNEFNVDATHVLDPTLLAGTAFFDRTIAQLSDEQFDLVYYKLDVDDNFIDLISEICSRFEYSSKDIYSVKKDGVKNYNSVENWIYSIANSKVVVTDSFHCVCLAIIYNKEFIYYPNENRGLARIQSLLDSLKIDSNNRIYPLVNPQPNKFLNDLDLIDYSYVNTELDALKKGSLRYILESLKKDGV